MNEALSLGVAEMDETHAEFLSLLKNAKQRQGNDFLSAFEALLEHTRTHFAAEEALMRSHSYYGVQEHENEHNTLLGEMRYFFEKAKKLPPMGRSYIDGYAYEKFHRHIINIDSQLAMFLTSQKEDHA